MTTKIITPYIFALLLSFAYIGNSYASASEVTGTLSAGTSGASSQTSGTVGGSVDGGNSISGTVSGGSSSGGSSRGGSSSGGSSNSGPTGQVLGAATDNVLAQATTPGFPNAGSLPDEPTPSATTVIASVLALGALLMVTLRRYKLLS